MGNELSYGEINKIFLKKYRELFIPYMKGINRDRFKRNNEVYVRFIEKMSDDTIKMLIAALVFCVTVLSISDNIVLYLPIFIIVFILLPFFIGWCDLRKAEEIQQYKNQIKINIMPKLMECVGLHWSLNEYNTNIFNGAGIKFNESKYFDESCRECYIEEFDDVISGKHSGLNFHLVERKIKAATKGYLILVVELNKVFNFKTAIKGKGSVVRCDELKSIKLDNVIFGKKINVCTKDENEARKIITSSFMENLDNLEKTFAAKLNGCLFSGNKLFIILKTKKDLFEPFLLNSSKDDAVQFFGMVEKIISVFRLIDFLKLNLKA